ncbi:MAG TPA: AsmA-like C-terminal region-containing protein [Acidobacteriota bacterium]|nr:AsmA-like C-terminal region-containing protein [Acidobacteriota bacterium]
MTRSRKLYFIAACVLAGALGAAALGTRLSIGADAYRHVFESAASDAAGLRVSVGGRFSVGFTGDLLLRMKDVRVRNADGSELLRAEEASIAIGVLPLLVNQRHVHRVTLRRPDIAIARNADGTLNWERRAAPRGTLPVLDRARISLTDGTVRYGDERSGAAIRATEVRANVRIKRRGFEADRIFMRVFGGEGRARMTAEVPDSVPRYRLTYTLSRFRIDDCLRTLSPDTIATGLMDFAANVSFRGRAPAEWTKSMGGDVTLRGEEITLHGQDLDHALSRFESSQNLDLMDVGSVLFVGPLGVLATKGFDFARLIGKSDGSTEVRAMVSAWEARGGALHARDVALATRKHRLALTGSLDVAAQRFDSVTVALVDSDGCAKVRQELRGTFRDPELKKPTVLASLLGPVRNVYHRAKDLLPGGPCTVFYAGSIPPPD